MPIPVVLDLGSPGSGWDVYFNVFSPDDTEVWNGSAFVTDSTAAQNAGGIDLTEDGGDPGRFEGEFPAAITTPGTYPIRARRQLGGSKDVTVDTLLTYDVAANAITLTGAEAVTMHAITFDLETPSAEPYGETEVIVSGEGRDWFFEPLTVPDDPTTEEVWEIVFTGFGMETPLSYKHDNEPHLVEVDLDLWTIRAIVLADQLAILRPGTWGTVDLIYQPDGDDRLILRRKLGRVVA